MSRFVSWQRFDTPEDRKARVPWLVLGYLGVILLLIWDPVGRPGPTLCLMRYLFAIPCPFCGLTRGTALTLRGQPTLAEYYNPLSVPVFVFLMGLLILWTIEFACNARLVIRMPWYVRLIGQGVLLLVVLATWIYMLTYRREDAFLSSWFGMLLRVVGWA